MYTVPVGTQTDRTADAARRFGCRRRIRGTMYIWGSQGITQDLQFPSPLILYLRNDAFGEPVTIRTEKADGTGTTLGTLQAGEYLALPVQDIRGVSVSCDLESTVSYMLSGDPGELCFITGETDHPASRPGPSDF
jgi:hypothetical protein